MFAQEPALKEGNSGWVMREIPDTCSEDGEATMSCFTTSPSLALVISLPNFLMDSFVCTSIGQEYGESATPHGAKERCMVGTSYNAWGKVRTHPLPNLQRGSSSLSPTHCIVT